MRILIAARKRVRQMNQKGCLGSGLVHQRFWNFYLHQKRFNSCPKIFGQSGKNACRAIQQLTQSKDKNSAFYCHPTGRLTQWHEMTIPIYYADYY